ncbi:hypothetical protein [Candidatus Nitrosopumilus sediminis]|nr:hypothetical protein [Candidatus Nitrosopumilus sediminis]
MPVRKKINIKDMLINELIHAKKRKQANHVPDLINLFTFKIVEV